MAYSEGDVVDGVTLTKSYPGYDNYITFSGNERLYLISDTDFYVDSGTLKILRKTTDNKLQVIDRSTGRSGAITSFNSLGYGIDRVVSCSVDIYDESGRKVFPQPPEPTPTPEPTPVPTPVQGTLLEVLLAQIPEVLHLILTIVIVVFLGGILLVIWKPLFRMLGTWLLTLFRR